MLFHFRQQKQQYTNQLAKETDKYIKEFGSLPTTPSDQVSSLTRHCYLLNVKELGCIVLCLHCYARKEIRVGVGNSI